MAESDDDPVYVCMSCGHEDDPDRFGRYCPGCGIDLDELEAEVYGNNAADDSRESR